MSEFYNVDSTRVSLREYWDETKFLFWLGWILKSLRIRTPCSVDDPNVDSTSPFVTESLPAFVATQFQPLEAQLNALGFTHQFNQLIQDPGTQTTWYWATFLHASGRHFARIQLRYWERAAGVKRKPFIAFFTEFADGTFVVTTGAKPDLLSPATVELKRVPGAKAERLWKLHEQRVEAVIQSNVRTLRIREEVIAALERHHVLLRDFNLARGVFGIRSATQKAKADAHLAGIAQARASGLDHAEVMVELDKLQEQKTNWRSTLWVLLGSLVLFIAAGAMQWKWKLTIWLIPVLFFHEAGHWLAMRVFKYRNLRMFFIPLFGAAVTGSNWNVPGWKKVMVSLAGPLPGIALGALATILGIVLNKPWLNQAALMLLILNGFNLLPVLPLDGGHVFHAILFCRNRWLDGAFRLVAALGLLGMAMLGMGKLLLWLGIIMAVALPIAFKMAKVTDKLRSTPVPPPLPGEDRIPNSIAQTIISEVKAEMPRGVGNKAIAHHTLSIFETLNARPPGVLASIALLILHFGGIVTALVFGALAVIVQHGQLADFFNAAVRQPQHTFSCGATRAWPDKKTDPANAAPRTLIIATLDDHAAAQKNFAGLTNRLPADSGLTLFGDSLLLALPTQPDALREKWFDELQTVSTNLFVAVSNRPVGVRLMAIAPEALAATNLTSVLEGYFQGSPGMNLVPPWSPAAHAPGFEAKLAARKEWQRLDQEQAAVWKDPALKAMVNKISTASRRGANADLRRLYEEQNQLREKLQAQVRERLRSSVMNRIDPELIDLHVALSKESYTNRLARAALEKQIAAKLGAIESDVPQQGVSANPYGVANGYITKHGLLLEISLRFNDPAAGLPALTQWLCDKKCAGIRYDFMPGFWGMDFDELEE